MITPLSFSFRNIPPLYRGTVIVPEVIQQRGNRSTFRENRGARVFPKFRAERTAANELDTNEKLKYSLSPLPQSMRIVRNSQVERTEGPRKNIVSKRLANGKHWNFAISSTRLSGRVAEWELLESRREKKKRKNRWGRAMLGKPTERVV